MLQHLAVLYPPPPVTSEKTVARPRVPSPFSSQKSRDLRVAGLQDLQPAPPLSTAMTLGTVHKLADEYSLSLPL